MAVETSSAPPNTLSLDILVPPFLLPGKPGTGLSACSAASGPPAFFSPAAIAAAGPAYFVLRGRAGQIGRGLDRGPAALREAGKGDRNHQRGAVEQGLDEEGAAELLDTRDANGEDEHAAHRAPDVDPAWLDGGGAEEGAHHAGSR